MGGRLGGRAGGRAGRDKLKQTDAGSSFETLNVALRGDSITVAPHSGQFMDGMHNIGQGSHYLSHDKAPRSL